MKRLHRLPDDLKAADATGLPSSPTLISTVGQGKAGAKNALGVYGIDSNRIFAAGKVPAAEGL
ncbi:hypothetical protein [Radicibacter daui]|uniref:hypothetical protein n=1 Tax=Radicibacter daui TaxID=3064829 RepID=UPI004046B4AF